MKAAQGDWLVVESAHTGQVCRRGLVLEAHGPDGTAPFLVRWTDDDHESLVFPGADAHVEPDLNVGPDLNTAVADLNTAVAER